MSRSFRVTEKLPLSPTLNFYLVQTRTACIFAYIKLFISHTAIYLSLKHLCWLELEKPLEYCIACWQFVRQPVAALRQGDDGHCPPPPV